MVEMSTLTGACLVGLGEKQAGLFSNDDGLAASLLDSATETGESVWRMPITDEHRDSIKGLNGDICNIGKTRYGGSCTAAAFLEHFVHKDV
jgi:leucyl aminopeptidase